MEKVVATGGAVKESTNHADWNGENRPSSPTDSTKQTRRREESQVGHRRRD